MNKLVMTSLFLGLYSAGISAMSVPLQISSIDVTPTGCAFTGSIIVKAKGGSGNPANYRYVISSSPAQKSNVFKGLAAGKYTVQVTDVTVAGGLATASALVGRVCNIRILSATTTQASGAGKKDGAISVSADGGVLPLVFAIKPARAKPTIINERSASFSGLEAGDYSVSVTSADGEVETTQIVVTQPAPIEFTLGVTDPSCAGLDDGVITVTATAGGVPPYSYRLKGGKSQASTELCGLSAGTFTVEVVDAHGCLAAKVVELKQPPQCNKK